MAKPTFKPINPKGGRMPEEAFTPIIYIVGTQVHRLALHKDLNRAQPAASKEWVVSEPISGARILTVRGYFKGAAVSSRGLGVKDAREAAAQCLDTMLEVIGSDKFNTTVAAAIAKYA